MPLSNITLKTIPIVEFASHLCCLYFNMKLSLLDALLEYTFIHEFVPGHDERLTNTIRSGLSGHLV